MLFTTKGFLQVTDYLQIEETELWLLMKQNS